MFILAAYVDEKILGNCPLTVKTVEQELVILPEHLSLPSVFSGVRVTRSLVLCVCFVDRCLSFCTFSFGHYVVCSSSIYWFWLPLWYLQTILNVIRYLFEKIQKRTLSKQIQNPMEKTPKNAKSISIPYNYTTVHSSGVT
jgi:hypothetical protein